MRRPSPRFPPFNTGSIHANSQSRRLRPARFRRRPRLQQFWPAHRSGDLAQGDPQGDRPRHHAVRHRRHLCRHGRLRDRARHRARRPPQGHRAGDEIFEAHEQRRHQAGRLAPLHHVGGRGQPDAAEDRLHRSLPAARLRSADADRRDACARSTIWSARARSATSAIRIFRPGASPKPKCRAADERQPLRLLPGRIQPRRARHRKGSAAGAQRNTISGCCRSSRWRAGFSPANTSAAPPPPTTPASPRPRR